MPCWAARIISGWKAWKAAWAWLGLLCLIGLVNYIDRVALSILQVPIKNDLALTDAQIVACCEAAERAGADFVKTSTGFHPAGGASTHAVALMRATVGDRLGVKASGGIRTAADALARIGPASTKTDRKRAEGLGTVPGKDGVRLLGNGEIKAKVAFEVYGASKSAVETSARLIER